MNAIILLCRGEDASGCCLSPSGVCVDVVVIGGKILFKISGQ